MGYKLKSGEGFPDNVKLVVLKQIDKALDNLRPTARNKDEAIHDARVCINKIRAVLRLIRDSLGKQENLPPQLEVFASTTNGTIMGLRHRELKIEGVQFHPESIMTTEGKKLLANFLKL